LGIEADFGKRGLPGIATSRLARDDRPKREFRPPEMPSKEEKMKIVKINEVPKKP
jgi:hypothetical protein